MSEAMAISDISGHCPKSNGTCPDGNGTCPDGTPTATDVMHAIDQLRRDLSSYHGQLIAHNELQKHCDNQRRRLAELEGLYAEAKAGKNKIAMAFSEEHDRAEVLTRQKAELRRERDMYRDLVGLMVHPDIPDRLQAENDKLRELVRDLWVAYNAEAEKSFHPAWTVDEALERRARAMGIEVDE